MNYEKRLDGNRAAKERFHRSARTALKKLAKALGLKDGEYDLRNNAGGPAVSGEITLHSDTLYVQASQPWGMGMDTGILIRSCNGRKDYTGGRNNFAPLNELNDIPALAERIRRLGLAQ